MGFKIGRLAKLTATTAPTIRYYESIGLLSQPHRSAGGQRNYGADDVADLVFIRRCRETGFSIADTRIFLDLMHDPENPCTSARDILLRHRDTTRSKISQLMEMERKISNLVASSNSCAGGPASACAVLGDVARRGGFGGGASKPRSRRQ